MAPGDVVVSTITEDSSSVYTFSMDDETQGWTVDAEQAMPSGYTGEGQTSEVITEATTECTSASASSCSIMPLTNFGNVAYTSATYNSGTAYTSSNTAPIELVQSGGVGDTVGALGAGGAFTVTYGLPTVVVPSEIGRTDLATAEAGIKAAGLVAKAAGASGAGNLGSVTARVPGRWHPGPRRHDGYPHLHPGQGHRAVRDRPHRPCHGRGRASGQPAWCRGRWAPAASGTRGRSPLSPRRPEPRSTRGLPSPSPTPSRSSVRQY